MTPESMAILREALAPLEDAAVAVDGKGAIVWFNDAATRRLGFKRAQDEGQELKRLLRSAQLDSLLERNAAEATLDMPAPHDRAMRLRLRWLPLDEGGVLLARDVTLQERVEKIRGELTANISHEMRTPLSVLRGYLELMEDGKLDDAARRRALADMREQSDRMLSMIEGLLELSTLEGQPDQAPRQPVALRALLREVMDEFRSKLPDGARMELNGDETLGVLGERELLVSVFRNLLDNACRHLPANGALRVDLRMGTNGAHVAISDDGPGIPPEHLPRVTERFYRVEHGRDAGSGGRGLGLAIVKHALSHHGAELRARNLKPNGCQFECLFPAWRSRDI